MMTGLDLPGEIYDGIAETDQAGIIHLEKQITFGIATDNLATVKKVYSDRNACDIESWNGQTYHNVPIVSKCGLINGQIFGELDLPAVDTVVIIKFVDGREGKPYISGMLVPYLYSSYQSGQLPINSTNKQYTKKLFESGKENYYRRIFKSGTTLEVKDDGSVIIETPSGSYFYLDEQNKKFILYDLNGNKIESSSRSIKINENLEVKQ